MGNFFDDLTYCADRVRESDVLWSARPLWRKRGWISGDELPTDYHCTQEGDSTEIGNFRQDEDCGMEEGDYGKKGEYRQGGGVSRVMTMKKGSSGKDGWTMQLGVRACIVDAIYATVPKIMEGCSRWSHAVTRSLLYGAIFLVDRHLILDKPLGSGPLERKIDAYAAVGFMASVIMDSPNSHLFEVKLRRFLNIDDRIKRGLGLSYPEATRLFLDGSSLHLSIPQASDFVNYYIHALQYALADDLNENGTHDASQGDHADIDTGGGKTETEGNSLGKQRNDNLGRDSSKGMVKTEILRKKYLPDPTLASYLLDICYLVGPSLLIAPSLMASTAMALGNRISLILFPGTELLPRWSIEKVCGHSLDEINSFSTVIISFLNTDVYSFDGLNAMHAKGWRRIAWPRIVRQLA